ncbi:type II toxin-antitoxin system VapC family toxin [Cupriavidus necator]|nr:type II toxin-antitoxin system VapC family toxin [Cupriavidus sp. UYPR2.512]UIF85893.1 type II toxin-antitoxin system VapC family toxin [Cupriavidus necator]
MMLVLDTNVVSELRKVRGGKADANVAAWWKPVSCKSSGGMRAWAAMVRAWLDHYVLPEFAGRVLPIDTAVALRCARLHVPDRQSERDALIAATAIVHGMTVVTRNVADFMATGVSILNPWEA